MLDRFVALDSSYKDQGIDFVLLDARSWSGGRRALDLPLPLLEDDGQLVSETLGITGLAMCSCSTLRGFLFTTAETAARLLTVR